MVEVHRCFVITPFGDPYERNKILSLGRRRRGNRELAALVDKFYQLVLRPVELECSAAGCSVEFFDGRQNLTEDDLYSKILKDIDRSDFVLALILGDRPNVYLEIGWAQMMWRKPICVVAKDAKFPSDIGNHEHEQFNVSALSKPGNPELSGLVKNIAKRIVQRVQNGAFRARPEFLPATTAAFGSIRVYNRFSKAIKDPDWASLIEQAQEEIIFCVPKMYKLTSQELRGVRPDPEGANGMESDNSRIPFFAAMLLGKALQGVRVTVLMNAESNLREEFLQQKYRSSRLDTERMKMSEAYDIWTHTIAESYMNGVRRNPQLSPDGFRVIQIARRYVPFRVTYTEGRSLTTLRFYSEPYNSMLCIDASAPGGPVDPDELPFHLLIKGELDLLINENAASSREKFLNNYRHLVPLFQERSA